MPLPAPNTQWPPTQLDAITPKLAEWDAWYVGDPERLVAAYSNRRDTARFDRPAQHAGGVVGALARFWWGRPINTASQRRDQLHVPAAADLARVSADLLYSEPPQISLDDTTAQDTLNGFIDDGLHDVLATGAEVGAALGGRYHRVSWDPSVADAPFLSTVDADAAWPEFRWGRLVAVTFWHVLASDGQKVIRHVERHELDGQGLGVVFHGLFEGTTTNLGRRIDLGAHTATAGLAGMVDGDGALVQGRTPGLAVAYIANQTPSRQWRTHPIGRHLGRSDLAGVEPLMDALDEAYSSLMRDVRLAKARIIVPGAFLESNGSGRGATFDLDREVYEAVHVPPTEDGRTDITPQQFEIRVDEHLRTADDLMHRIIATAGYSAQTLSDGVEGGQMTATEVHSRERRSYLTRDRKIRHERPAVAHLARKLLTVNAAVFGRPTVDVEHVKVTFADTVQDSLVSLASSAQMLATAQAASTFTRVQLVHPDWDKKQVDEEVAAILAENASLPDPYTFAG